MRDPVRRHHRALSVRRRHLVLADVSARPARARPRGLLHRRHRRVRLRSGAEHARDRSGLRHHATSTTRSSRSGSATAGRSSTTTAAITAAAPTTVQRLRADADLFINLSGGSWFWRDEYARIPQRSLHRFRSGVHPAGDRQGRAVVRRVLPALRPPVHVRRRTSARRRRRSRPASSRGTRPGSRSRSTTGGPTRRPARSLHLGDDLADRELHRRRRQQGSGVRQVHRPAVADGRSPSSWRSTARSSCCGSTAGHTVPRCSVSRTPEGLSRLHPGVARPSSASPSTPTSRPGRAGSAIAPSAISRPGRPALVQDTGWTAHLPSGEGLLAFSTPDEALAGIDRINGDYPRHAATGAPRSRASTSTRRVVLPALLARAA